MKKVFIIIPIVLAIIGTGVFMAVRMERKERHAAKAMELDRQAKREALRAEVEELATGVSGRTGALLRHAEVVKRASAQSRLSSAFLAANPALKKVWPGEPPEGPHQELTAEIAAGALAAIAVEGRRLLKAAPKLAAEGQALLERIGPKTSLKELGEVVEEMRSLDQRLADSTSRMNANVRLAEALGAQLEESTMARARARNAAKTDVHRELEARAYQKLAVQEVAAVEKWRPQQRKRLLAHDYAGLVRAAVHRAKACKTDEGRAAYGVMERRYRKLEWLKTYMIDRINKQPLLWAWGQGRAKQDIVKADAQTLRTRSGDVKWSEVQMHQFMSMVRRYRTEFPVPPTISVNLNLALAVLYHEHGHEEEARKILAAVSLEGPLAQDALAELFPDYL